MGARVLIRESWYYLNFEGKHRPILEQGWTLDFEMLFYAIFALALLFKRTTGLAFLALALGFFVLLPDDGLPVALQIWSDPIILYFLCGVTLGLMRKSIPYDRLPGGKLSPLVPTTALFALFIALDNLAPHDAWMPIFSALIVTLAVLWREIDHGALTAPVAVYLGNISYSLYLSHGIVLLIAGIAWRQVFGGTLMPGFYLLTLCGCFVAAALCYQFLEKPLIRIAGDLTGTRGRIAPPAA